MSARVLLQWLNERLDTNMKGITEMSDGWQYCQLLDMMFEKAIPLSKVIFKAKNEEQRLANFKLVMTFLHKAKADVPNGEIDIQKLVKGHQTHNLSFLSWFKRWCDQEIGDEIPVYNAMQRRKQASSKTPSGSTPVKERRLKRKADSPTVRCLSLDDLAPPPTTKPPTLDAAQSEAGPAMSFIMNSLSKKPRTTTTTTTPSYTATPIITERTMNTDPPAKTKPSEAEPNPLLVQRLRDDLRKYQDDAKKRSLDDLKGSKSLKDLESRLSKSLEEARQLEEKVKHLEKQHSASKQEAKENASESKMWRDKAGVLQQHIENATDQLRDKDDKINKAAEVRRMLHNSLQELKGNIRVFARLRPFLRGECSERNLFGFPDDLDNRKIEVSEPPSAGVTGVVKASKSSMFEFDKVFSQSSSQSDIFREVSQLVQSVLDGYKVCIFAYGQTGSGKTYTMEGSEGDAGLIPRTVQQLFERSKEMTQQGWDMSMKGRYVEIYNDKLKDLLGDGTDDKKIEIHHSKTGDDTHLTNCSLVPVTDAHSVRQVLETAKSRRTVAATKMNELSSRSHSVFTLKITGKNEGTGQLMSSEINLIDLAGSERVKDSGVTGEALKEAEHINTSLTHLGNVIQQLHANKGSKKTTHIFRNSQLTWLLKSCLGGDCKTLMMVNISPAPTSLPESVNSLRFATKVNSCQIGTASRRVK
eukprot:TRINITY_DN2101_c0_g2_i1.p1 TRINITY_DN2101_c0_g2~~TRINITY_DN2101_c0_g2_i1.p1  ORF type:complete len:698 (+),score=179.99 TRINITY_DN2101_c0_g2_i1:60-2153(+)